MLPHWDRSCRSNFLSHSVTVYWHRANQSRHWHYIARRLAGQPLECQFFFKSLVWLDPGKIQVYAGFEPQIFRSRSGRLNHLVTEAVHRLSVCCAGCWHWTISIVCGKDVRFKCGGLGFSSRPSHTMPWLSSFLTVTGSSYNVCWLVGCLTSQQHASVSQARICSDNFTCCHAETEVADHIFYLTQSQYTDTRPTSPSADPVIPGAWQGIHWSAIF